MTKCWWVICFQPLSSDGEKIFGFSEFLASLALMVLAWTLADARYRFRLRTAPLPLEKLSFVVISVVGALVLLTDVWRAESFPVPIMGPVTPAIWQALLGTAFLLVFLSWVWFAFLGPSKFGKWTAERIYTQLYRAVLRGSAVELPEIADELSRSACALVSSSWQSDEIRLFHEDAKNSQGDLYIGARKPRTLAYQILQLLGDRRMAHHIVRESPATAGKFFYEMALQKKYDLPLGSFARNVTAEAISNRSSFVYQEVSAYDTGLIGHQKPLTTTIYKNYDLLKGLRHALDVDPFERKKWDEDQWEAFSRIVLIAFQGFATSRHWGQHSSLLFRVVHDIERAVPYFTNHTYEEWSRSLDSKIVQIVMKLAVDIVEVMDSAPEVYVSRRGNRDHSPPSDISDLVTGLFLAVVRMAATFRGKQDACWSIHYGEAWEAIRELARREGWASQAVSRNIRRSLFAEVVRLESFPNALGANILGLLWNVLGIEVSRHDDQDRVLRQAVISWTRRNFARFYRDNPRVSSHCFVDGIEFDQVGMRLVKSGIAILDYPRYVTYLKVDDP